MESVRRRLEEAKQRVEEKRKNFPLTVKFPECTPYCVFMNFKFHEAYHAEKTFAEDKKCVNKIADNQKN